MTVRKTTVAGDNATVIVLIAAATTMCIAVWGWRIRKNGTTGKSIVQIGFNSTTPRYFEVAQLLFGAVAQQQQVVLARPLISAVGENVAYSLQDGGGGGSSDVEILLDYEFVPVPN